MNNELQGIRKETLVVVLKYYTYIFLNGQRNITNISVRIAGVPAEDGTAASLEHNAEKLPLGPTTPARICRPTSWRNIKLHPDTRRAKFGR